jgi:hypothetical protein
MCEPVTLGIGAGLAVAGSGMSAYNSVEQGKAEQDAANANAVRARLNAKRLNQSAGDAMVRGEQDAGIVRMKGSAAVSDQKVALAANGLDVQGEGAANLMANTKYMNEVDVQTTLNNAQREAYGYRVEANNALEDARQFEKAGVAARKRGEAQATATLLGGAGQVLDYGGKMYDSGSGSRNTNSRKRSSRYEE